MSTTPDLAAFPEAIANPFNVDPAVALPAKRAEYEAAKPFRFAVFDGLFSEELLDRVLEEVATGPNRLVERDQKSYRKHIAENWTRQGPYANYLINLATSPRFLDAVEKLTGISGLLFDPKLAAGGIHETHSGGFLELHTDFNWNARLRLFRRLNFLLYLNRDWKEEYNGHLQVWDQDLKTCKKVLPLFNRLVICDVVSNSLHGFPDPLRCPEDMTRKSLALWYYTSDQPANVQTGWDLCEPAFVERSNGSPLPLSRPWWRQILPPVLTHFVKRKSYCRSFSSTEFKHACTRFVPPVLMQVWHKLSRKRTY